VDDELAPVFVLTDSLPPVLAEKWRDRVTLVSQEEWGTRSSRLPAILFTPHSVLTVGPFVRLRRHTRGARNSLATADAIIWA
jgi:hypothetical protein